MTTLTRYTIKCDGCGAHHSETHDSILEARAAAYAAGWRYPARYKASGSNSRETDDVCPACVAEWKPRPVTDRWARRRAEQTTA